MNEGVSGVLSVQSKVEAGTGAPRNKRVWGVSGRLTIKAPLPVFSSEQCDSGDGQTCTGRPQRTALMRHANDRPRTLYLALEYAIRKKSMLRCCYCTQYVQSRHGQFNNHALGPLT